VHLIVNNVVSLLEKVGSLARLQEISLAKDVLEAIWAAFCFFFQSHVLFSDIVLLDLIQGFVAQSMAHLLLLLICPRIERFVANDVDFHVLRDVLQLKIHRQFFLEETCLVKHLITSDQFALKHPSGVWAGVEDFEVATAVKAILAGDHALPTKDSIQESNVVKGLEVATPYSNYDHDDGGGVEHSHHALNEADRLTWLRNHLEIC
jgi:hypothetical protein